MLLTIFTISTTISIVFSVFNHTTPALSGAILDGASLAVELCLATLGTLCLWSGVVSVLDGTGITRLISKAIKPILRFVFPRAYKFDCGINEICASFAANFLGLGNAALPLSLDAMKKLSLHKKARPDMYTFAVMNAFPLQAFPATLISLLKAAGDKSPYDIMLPIYICSIITCAVCCFICRVLCAIFKGRL